MAKIKYFAKENQNVGTHSFYGKPIFAGTLNFDEMCEEACRNTSIEVSFMKAAVTEYMKAVKANTLKGFRCPLGDQFLTVYPNLQVSVKDKQANGQTVVATAAMVKAQNAKSRLGCTVHPKFSAQFANEVSWQKVDAQGNDVDEDDDITQGNDNVDGGGGGGGVGDNEE